MSGYQPFATLRAIVVSGPPPMPVVDRALVRPAARRQRKVNRNTPPDASTIALMKSMRSEGKSLRVIREATGFTNPTIRRHTADVPVPEGGWPSGARVSKLNKAFAERLHRAGFTFREIGEEVGCSEAWAYRLVHGDRRRRSGPRTRTTEVVLATSKATGIPCAALRQGAEAGPGRQRQDIARARAIVFWILNTRFGASYSAIARSMGGFDHTAVRCGCLRARAAIEVHGIIDHPHIGRMAGQLWRMTWPRLAEAA